MQALTFEIVLQEPLLAGQAQSGEENSTVAFNFVPGSMIRGALIARYQQVRREPLDAADPKSRALFFDGTIRYLNGYLVHPRQGVRMLPTPASWYGRKDEPEKEGAQVYDRARTTLPDTDESYKAIQTPFCWWGEEDDKVQFMVPTMQQLAHNFSRNRSRKEAETSGVFRYEAIAPGQRFAAAIIAKDGAEELALLQRIQPLLRERFFLGGSQTGGYGAVEIENVQLNPRWQEYQPSTSRDEEGRLVLTCLSDVILRNDAGEMTDGLHEWVGLAEPSEGPRSFHKLRRVGGFNRKWGLPLPQSWAIQTGSVFLFEANKANWERLAELAESGIGERQAEGFGRVALQWLPQAEFTRAAIEPTATARPTVLLSSMSRGLLHHMVRRQLEAQIDQWLATEISARVGHLKLHGLTATQLSRARLAARQAWHAGNLGPLKDFFEEDAMTKRTAEEWRKARIDQEPLLQWVADRLKATTSPISTPELPQIGEVVAQYDDTLHARTTARLIEGVLRRAVRQAQREQEAGKEAQDG